MDGAAARRHGGLATSHDPAPTLRRRLRWAVLLGLAGGRASAPSWETLLPQHDRDEHAGTRPSFRYSHTLTVVGSEIVLVHGYFYDHRRHRTNLCKDAWAFADAADGGEPGWRLIADGTAVPSPQGRMSHVAVPMHAEGTAGAPTLVLFGGDIGVSSTQKGNTKLRDLWVLDVRSGLWTEIVPSGGSAAWPGARAACSGVLLGGALVVYGGRGHAGTTYGDLWRFDMQSKTWELLIGESPPEGSGDHAGARAAHVAVVGPGGRDMYVYGGYRPRAPFSGRLDDMWVFKSDEVAWREVPQANSDGGRANFAMALYPLRLEGEERAEPGFVAFAGSQCAPRCLLSGRLSFFSLRTRLWYQVPVSEEPYTRYHHGMVACNGSLVHFGGETYEPYMYHNSVNRIVLASIPNVPRPPFEMPSQEL